MTEQQFNKCLTCLNRREGIYDKKTICNLRGRNLNFVGECQNYDYDENAKSVTENQNIFEVYEKLKGPFFTLETAYFVMTVLIVILGVSIEIYGFKQYEEFFWLLAKLYIVFIVISQIIFFNKIEKLYAKHLGQLVISKDKIQILNKKIDLSEIKKINFYNNDFIGMRKDLPIEGFIFSPRLSNGINNFLILKLNNGESKRYRFLQKTKEDLLRNRDILIHYYLNDKLNFDDLKRILHLHQKRDIQSLINEIEAEK